MVQNLKIAESSVFVFSKLNKNCVNLLFTQFGLNVLM